MSEAQTPETSPESRHVHDLFDLTGRVAVVTGGAGQYGRHISAALAEAGAHVVVASRNLAACENAVAALTTRGLGASAQPLDLTSERSIRALRDALLSEHGRLDILVNNAVYHARGGLEFMSAEDWDAASLANSKGLFLMTRHCVEPMVCAGSGSIVNISSIYGVVAPDFSIYPSLESAVAPSYAFEKGGMISFTRYVASFYAAKGIRANCISPSGLETPGLSPEFVSAYRERTPMGRMAGSDDIKGAVVFLASDASAFVTGANLIVDGGWTLR